MVTKLNWIKNNLFKSEKILAIVNIIGLILVFIFLILNYNNEGFIYIVAQGDADYLVDYFDQYDLWMTSLVILALVLVEVVIGIIPAIAMYPIIGLVVGIEMGFVLISIGNIVGNSLNYWQGRIIAGAFLKHSENLNLIKKMQGGGVKELILIRINPITSFDSVSYIAGALGMKFKHFLIATLVGVTPLILLGVTIGEELLDKYKWSINALMIFIGLTVAFNIFKKIKSKLPEKVNSSDNNQ